MMTKRYEHDWNKSLEQNYDIISKDYQKLEQQLDNQVIASRKVFQTNVETVERLEQEVERLRTLADKRTGEGLEVLDQLKASEQEVARLQTHNPFFNDNKRLYEIRNKLEARVAELELDNKANAELIQALTKTEDTNNEGEA